MYLSYTNPYKDKRNCFFLTEGEVDMTASLAVAELVDDGIAFSGGIVFSGVRSGKLRNGDWVGDSMIFLLFLASSWAFSF